MINLLALSILATLPAVATSPTKLVMTKTRVPMTLAPLPAEIARTPPRSALWTTNARSLLATRLVVVPKQTRSAMMEIRALLILAA